MSVYRSIKRLFKRLKQQQIGNVEQRLSDHRTVASALRMARSMTQQRLTGSPLARGEG
ncbi:hypothetical protein GMLC_14930 [Geomonas limicola]|uniref:Uncharacterized protein n=1 Tax=Geomonas limicola TaxID=2740186 RepID=A0A6V8N7J1_9BACT|nr:hypothetical protein GMLC_14930 [Geomonas limicola]